MQNLRLDNSVCIVSGIRLKFLLDVDFNGDASYQIGEANIWSFLEPTLGMTIGCIPTMRPLYLRIMGRSPNSSGSRQSGKKGSSGYGGLRYGRTVRQSWKRMSNQTLPLTDATITANMNADELPGHAEGAYPNEASGDNHELGSVGGIEVTRQWEVQSQRRNDL